MTAPESDDAQSSASSMGDLVDAWTAALSARTREAFTRLLTDDVCWGGERGGAQCSNRSEAGAHYAGLLAAGVSMSIADLSEDGDGRLTAVLTVASADPDTLPAQVPVRLTMRDGLIADIRELDPPPTIELLYFDGCPHNEQFLPHLRQLLADHAITAPIVLTRIDSDDDAQAHRFLGSPTLRINGRDVDPTADDRTAYGMQCRLYRSTEGVTGAPADQWILDALVPNPAHDTAVTVIHSGDLDTLQRLLDADPGLAAGRLRERGGRTLLHIATDWPGHYPNVAATITLLIAAGADPDSPSLGEHAETPLHWAASSDDVEALDALLDNGADINAPGAVIAGGTPMADATAFGQWAAARRLLDRGATTTLFDAAALGEADLVRRHLLDEPPSPKDLTSCFWGACHGGHVSTATVLLDHGADLNWIGYDHLTPLDAAQRSQAFDVAAWLKARGALTAADLEHAARRG